jgi:hypothetical protein
MGIDIGEPELDFRDAMRILSRLGLLEEPRPLEIGGEDSIEQGLLAPWRFLGHRADPGIARQADRPRLRLQVAQDQMQEGRFAHAIAAHQADLVAARYGNGGIVEQKPPGNAVGQSVHMQHGRAV